MARIILNADDFGFDAETTRDTIACFEAGGLTSATIMANMPATQEAAAFATRHPQFGFGAHLTLTSDGVEFPVLPASQIPDLTIETGQFLSPLTLRRKLIQNRCPAEQLDAELEAQLGRLRDLGVPLTHVDSHGHVHKYKALQEALRRVLPRFGIHRVRSAQNVFLRRPLKSLSYWMGPFLRRRLARSFSSTPHFYMPTTAWDRDWTEPLLQRMPDGIVEVGVHPGTSEPWRRLEAIECVRFAAEAVRRGHALVTWSAV